MSEFEVYIWLKLDDVRLSLGLITLGAFALAVILTGFTGVSYEELTDPTSQHEKVCRFKKFRLWTVLSFSTVVFVFILRTMLPSTQQYAMIRVLPAVCRSTAVQRDLPELYTLGVNALKEKLSAAVKTEEKK